MDDDDSDELTGPDLDEVGTVRAALQKLSTEQREILNLVYRYGIDTYELPAILGIDAASVAELLTDAEIRFVEAVRLLDQATERAGTAGDRTDDTRQPGLTMAATGPTTTAGQMFRPTG